jgi:hypothetical protein
MVTVNQPAVEVLLEATIFVTVVVALESVVLRVVLVFPRVPLYKRLGTIAIIILYLMPPRM